MDDVSSGSGMGYDNFYFTSDVSRELESMSHGSAICNRPEDEDQVNIHQENSMENWITNDETNSDQKKFCVIDNHMGIGDDWLQGSIHVNERTKSSAEDEDNFSAGDEEERYNADDEDKFSTEEEIKYSAEEDDTTLSTEEEVKYSADEDEAKYCLEDVKSSGEEDEVKYSTEEDETKYSADEECKISTEEEGKYSADELDDEWLGTQGHVDGQFEERTKERWVGCSEYGVGDTEQQWQSSSEEVEHSSTESEVELSEEDQEEVINKGTGDLPCTSSVSFGEATVAQPVLCFDEYGNLTTTYHSPTVNSVKMPNLSTEKMLPESKNISVSLPINELNKRKSGSASSEECIEEPYNGEVKALRSRSKVGQESGENVLSDQELKQAFKEEFMTAATSRYGRARKRKTEDGFFFGTINFNELRKITSGSPKKSKGSSSKNSSPEQKMKHVTKEDLKDKFNVDQVNEEVIQNGTVEYDEGEGGEIRGNISSSKVQISETKDEILVQTSSVGQSDSSDKDLNKYIRNKHDTHRDLKLKNDTASNGGIGKNANVEEQMNMNFKSTNLGTQEGNSTNVDTTESGDSIDDVSDRASIYDRRRRLSLRKRSCSVTRVNESHSIVSSDRLLRGRSDVSRIQRSLQACEQVVPHKRPKKIIPEIEPPMYVSNSASTDSQETPLDDEEDPEPLTRPPSTRKSSQEFKAESEELASITKSGRIIRKPQLMDISNEDKRQKLSREQQRQSVALLSSSLDEELAHTGLDMRALEQENPCKHLVGDLVWVHIRGSPLWPAMISYDPILGQFSKVSLTQNWHKVRSIRMYHVQFFSDNALTYWIAPGNVLPFEGFVKLKEFLSELKCKLKGMKRYKRLQTESLLKTLVHMNKISSGQKHERWIKAIEEAKAASAMDRYERIQKYALENSEIEDKEDIHRFVKSSPRNLSLLNSKDPSFEPKPEKRKRGRPRKISLQNELPILKSLKSNGDSTDGEFSGFDENSSCDDKKKKLNVVSKLSMESDFAVYTQKHLEEFMLENPEMSAETAQNKLRWKWKKMSSSQTARYKSKFTCGDKYMLKNPEVNRLKRKHDIPFEEGDGCEENEGLSAKRQRTEEEVESIRGVYKVVRNEKVCYRCESVSNKAGADMIRCKGLCCGVFHLSCLGLTAMPKRDFKCEECQTGQHPCFLCKSFVGVVQRCTVPFCGKYYHEDCVQKWPQVSKQRQQERFVCPRHACHMCAANADDMGDPVARNPPFTRCLRCPTTYHTGEDCIAAGTEEVSQNHHICTKHLQLPKNGTHHVNVNWCFCCSKGGSLLLCDQCPAAFHADCMKITAPEGGYVCEDCEFGKFPIYGDIVWVKLGLYRWWPGQVLHPRFIPDNIENLQHQQGMFCVHFFGSNDYYWVTRGRAFLYQEGDKGSRAQSSKTLEMQFRRALEEAAEAYRAQKTKKTQREIRWSEKGNLKPPPYVRVDSNRPVGNIRLSKLDLAAVNRCDCDPYSENPCGSDEKCLNRMLMFECVREVCGAGDRCGNQRFQKRQYPTVCSFRTESRGWGLKTNQNIKKGEFVIEYVGELIDDEEFQRRILGMHEVKEENYYFLTIDKDIMIDAGPKGNLARFMNHSCQPNCETQKWTVGGDTRVGLFAIEDIPAGFELTFNYNLQCVGTEKKRCCCGAPNCSGFIGVKVQKAEVSGPKREKLGKQRRKRRRREAKLSEDECFRCGSPGDLILCDVVACPKGYHLECLGLDKLPRGKWICPWHHCDECGQRSARLNRCDFCPNSFCRLHLQGNLQHLNGIGTVCQDHNTDELETLRGQMGTTAVTENLLQIPKKTAVENSAIIDTEEKSQSMMNKDSSDMMLQCSDNSNIQAPSIPVYENYIDSSSCSKAQDETGLQSPQVNALPLQMKTGTGRPSKLSGVREGHENCSAVLNVTGSGGDKKTPKQRQFKHKRTKKLFSFHRKGFGRQKRNPENNVKQVNEA